MHRLVLRLKYQKELWRYIASDQFCVYFKYFDAISVRDILTDEEEEKRNEYLMFSN